VGERVLEDPSRLMGILKEERIRHREHQADIADLLGVTVSMVSLYEHNKKAPKPAAVRKWLKHYELPEAWVQPWVAWEAFERTRRDLIGRGRVSSSDIARIAKRIADRGGR
jgi:transcriptional regulator with XRE-family HTH domain